MYTPMQGSDLLCIYIYISNDESPTRHRARQQEDLDAKVVLVTTSLDLTGWELSWELFWNCSKRLSENVLGAWSLELETSNTSSRDS